MISHPSLFFKDTSNNKTLSTVNMMAKIVQDIKIVDTNLLRLILFKYFEFFFSLRCLKMPGLALFP